MQGPPRNNPYHTNLNQPFYTPFQILTLLQHLGLASSEELIEATARRHDLGDTARDPTNPTKQTYHINKTNLDILLELLNIPTSAHTLEHHAHTLHDEH